MTDDIKHGLDFTAVTIAFATLIKWLPAVASALTVIWLGLRIWAFVVDRWFNKDKQ